MVVVGQPPSAACREKGKPSAGRMKETVTRRRQEKITQPEEKLESCCQSS